ncbi:sensory box/GGDEF family protein [Vibrio astriarenae]|nr:sensory box/GGDEF family protein [Vibrio sp. C7]
MGKPLSSVITQAALFDVDGAIDELSQWHGEVVELHKAGYEIPLLVKIANIHSEHSNRDSQWLVMISDLSESKEMERLSYLAHHDALTGLANRASLYKELEVLQSAQSFVPYALLYADLDGFKEVNDQFGHDAGDEVLKVVAKRLQNQVRGEDLVVRLAGDEFIIVLRSCDQESLAERSNALIEHVSRMIHYKGVNLKVGVSIGVYWSQESSMGSNEVMKVADTAMYEPKALVKVAVSF